MPKCRCKPACELDIVKGTPVVYVSFFNSPKATVAVTLEHLRQTEIPMALDPIDVNLKRQS